MIFGCDSSLPILELPGTKSSVENSLLLVPGQTQLPESIKGVQFYRNRYPGSPPVIRLDTQDQLLLRFDELTSLSGQFKVSFSHYNQDWTKSGLADIWIFDGVNDQAILGGQLNVQSKPNYFSYEYKFPNSDINFLVSGNYLITVSDFNSGIELFSLPFFVTENVGELEPGVQTFFNSGPYSSAMDQVNGVFSYPDFVEFPQFDLSYRITQNRFWRNSVVPSQVNFDTEGRTSFRLTRDQFLPAYVEFNSLDLRFLSQQNPQIFGYEPEKIPERVILQNDYFNFSSDRRSITETGFGRPLLDADARYVTTLFTYDTQGALPSNSDIYLLGDFNQWTINRSYKLSYDTAGDFFSTEILVKQGLYTYAYAIIEDGIINQLRNIESLTQKPQEYGGFVYYKDPVRNFDRLLSTRIFFSE